MIVIYLMWSLHIDYCIAFTCEVTQQWKIINNDTESKVTESHYQSSALKGNFSYFFSNPVMNSWTELPQFLIYFDSINSFKIRLDNYWPLDMDWGIPQRSLNLIHYVEYFHFMLSTSHIVQEIRKSQEILGNQDSANPWSLSESIKIRNLIHPFLDQR